MNNHQALYRTYRPKTFDQMVGQEHIVRSLKNQIKNNTLSHAYIFNGTRGVGKTTAARIFARAINCLDIKDGNPCLKCKICTENAQNVDIIEIDSASYNGVDAARELREKAGYAPAQSKYKVYIIDEAHMLTPSAFDALLKILEEPPSYTIFVLCTTEIQKFPATIMSRCMRFDFKLASVEQLVKLLKPIFKKIKVEYTDDALYAIAVAGEGSYRDALTVADRCIAYCEGKLTYSAVTEVLGITGKETLISLADAILGNDTDAVLRTIHKLVGEGKSVGVLNRDLCRHFRDLLVILNCKGANKILRYPEVYFEKMEKSAQSASATKLLYAVEMFAKAENNLRTSLNPQVLLEATALRICACSGEVDCDGLDMRISRIERQLKGGTTAANLTATQGQRDTKQIQPNADRDKSGEKTVDTKDKSEKTEVKDKSEKVVGAEGTTESKSNVSDGQNKGKAQSNEAPFTDVYQPWSAVIEQTRLRRMTLLRRACTDIGSIEIVGKEVVAQCNVTQYSALTDKANVDIINGVLGGFGLRLKAVLTKQEQQLEQTDGILIGENVIIKKG